MKAYIFEDNNEVDYYCVHIVVSETELKARFLFLMHHLAIDQKVWDQNKNNCQDPKSAYHYKRPTAKTAFNTLKGFKLKTSIEVGPSEKERVVL